MADDDSGVWMRFLVQLESEQQVTLVADDDDPSSMPQFVRDCASRTRDLRADLAHFFADAPPRRFGPPDSTQPERGLWHLSLAASDRSPAGTTGTLELGNLAVCQALERVYTGEYFAYLLTQSEPGRTNSLVGYSTNPLREVCLYNARQERASGGWMLDAAVAGFTCKEEAADFGQSLVTGTRGKDAKRDKIPWLATAYNKQLYSYKQQPAVGDDGLAQVLARYSDPCFTEVYREMQTTV
jgi:hypothetical protein